MYIKGLLCGRQRLSLPNLQFVPFPQSLSSPSWDSVFRSCLAVSRSVMSLSLSRNSVNALIWPVLPVVQCEFLFRTKNFVGSFIPCWIPGLPPISIRILAFVYRLCSRVNWDSIPWRVNGLFLQSVRTGSEKNQTPDQ